MNTKIVYLYHYSYQDYDETGRLQNQGDGIILIKHPFVVGDIYNEVRQYICSIGHPKDKLIINSLTKLDTIVVDASVDAQRIMDSVITDYEILPNGHIHITIPE